MTGIKIAAAVDRILAAPGVDDPDRIVEQFCGERPHKSSSHRDAARGADGVWLRVAAVGRGRYTTARGCAEYWLALADARRAATETTPGAAVRPRHKRGARRGAP